MEQLLILFGVEAEVVLREAVRVCLIFLAALFGSYLREYNLTMNDVGAIISRGPDSNVVTSSIVVPDSIPVKRLLVTSTAATLIAYGISELLYGYGGTKFLLMVSFFIGLAFNSLKLVLHPGDLVVFIKEIIPQILSLFVPAINRGALQPNIRPTIQPPAPYVNNQQQNKIPPPSPTSNPNTPTTQAPLPPGSVKEPD